MAAVGSHSSTHRNPSLSNVNIPSYFSPRAHLNGNAQLVSLLPATFAVQIWAVNTPRARVA